MKILFHTNQIAERGTEVAIYDYAEGNESILKGISYIAAPADRVFDETVLKRFRDRFSVLLYKDRDELETFARDSGIELFYQIVSGDKAEETISGIRAFSHCVFSTARPFGDYYCPISEFLNRHYRTHYPVLPHIVKKFPGNKGDLRNELGIPSDAIVIGGYGGRSQFDIPFVKKAVRDVASADPQRYFLFMNFDPFLENAPNVVFLPKHTDIDYKEKFINTCDAMIHGRSDGETFGISIAEFSVKNKPVFTWKPDWFHNFGYCLGAAARKARKRKHRYATAHLDFLGRKAMAYHRYSDLARMLNRFKPKDCQDVNWDCYSDRFSPENVMKIFREIIMEDKRN